jgi:hypothetical protein
MPVERFRSLEEAEEALRQRTDVDLARRIEAAWALAGLLAPPRPFRGVRTFRSIQEAARERAERGRAAGETT